VGNDNVNVSNVLKKKKNFNNFLLYFMDDEEKIKV